MTPDQEYEYIQQAQKDPNILGLDERTVAAHLSRGLRDLQRRYAALVQSEVMAEVAA